MSSMDQAAMKRAADFISTDESLNKRSRIANGYTLNIDTDATFQRQSSISSRSPGSPKQHILQSAEVAADFKDSLQDLHGNDRYQISNLTIIAKESTEHALAISKVLENHIQKTPPPRKLPALYVLDSIVKNVGTPYTIYLGQNLYKTFMEAYTLVDGQTRKNMEGMLKTWKEPIPGSMEARPVFPVDIVRPIENALIKARTAFVQQQQQQARTQRQFHALPPRPTVTATPQPWTSIPTPPHTDSRFPPPPLQQPEQRYAATPEFQYGNPAPSTVYQSQISQPAPFYSNQYPGPPPTLQQYQQTQQQTLPAPAPTPPSAQFQSSYSLIALLQAAGTFPPQTPQPQQAQATLSIPSQPLMPPTPFAGLEALFKHTNTPDLHAVPFPLPNLPIPQAQQTPIPAFALPAVSTPPVMPVNSIQPRFPIIRNDVQLSTNSLKVPRPSLLKTIYSALPSQCGTCGRRFPLDVESKARKARHLDAHFRANRSLADAARRGISRNWYLDELEWIRSREFDDADDASTAPLGISSSSGPEGVSSAMGGKEGLGLRGVVQKDVFVKAPADAAVARHACPICQDEFAAVWHDGAQEWVWMDVVDIGGRVYHKSCLEELAKDKKAVSSAGLTRVKVEAGAGGVVKKEG